MRSFLLTPLAAVLLYVVPIGDTHAAIDRTVEKSFTVQPGGTISVLTGGGNITVQTGTGSAVTVVALEHIHAASPAEADELLRNLDLTIAQTAGGVTAQSHYEKDGDDHFGNWPPVQVSFTVTVPARYSADLNTSGGTIVVGDLDGAVKAHTSGGNIRLGKISGNADVHTSGGNISVAGLGGPLHAHTSGGNISAAFTSPPKSDCDLTTSGGRVRVSLPPGSGYHLDASTSGGRVRANGLAITIDQGAVDRGHLSGVVGAGGPRLHLHSSGGDILID